MASANFRTDLADNILTITFSRPEEQNRLTATALVELTQLFDYIDATSEIKAVILTGEGRYFCTGADLSEGFVAKGQPLSAGLQEIVDEAGTIAGVPRDGGGVLTLRMAQCTKPLIAAFNGPAVGVGVTLTLPMDIRIAAASARFGFVFARRGLMPEAASSWFLPRVVGVSQALQWCLTGRVFDATEARQGGLVSEVVPDDQLLSRARELATEIVANTSAVSVSLTRRTMWAMMSASSPWDAHAIESQAIWELAASPDGVEGVMSFLEKRPAQFPGRVPEELPSFMPHWPPTPRGFEESTSGHSPEAHTGGSS